MDHYLKATPLLDFTHQSIKDLLTQRNWQALPITDKVKAIYNFVRDEVRFGYNSADDIPASQVLQDGYGQCNTKATLLMALLRASGIPCRIHGFTIHKALQKGAVTGIWYKLTPDSILHSWVEVYVHDQWYFLEGVILDQSYLAQLQKKYNHCHTTFCGYGVYTHKFQDPDVDWNLNHTYIQEQGINQDFGVFDNPDIFYAQHQQDLGFIKKLVFKYVVRHLMNQNIEHIRAGK